MRRPHRGLARAAAVVGMMTVPLLLAAAPAAGEITSGTGCFGDATITGTTYTQDQSQKSAIVMPEEDGPEADLVVPYNGNVTFDNRSHSGSFAVMIGPFPITVADWGSPNTDDDRDTDPGSTYNLKDGYDQLPTLRGQFLVRGTHSAMGGGCSGTYLLEFPGNALESPVTIVGIVGAGVSVALIVFSGRRRPIDLGPDLGAMQ